MALTLEELYARRAQQRQAQRGLLNSPFAPAPRMGGMGGSTMRAVPDMAEPGTVVPSDLPDIEMGGGAMPRETVRQMMEDRSGGIDAPRMQPDPGASMAERYAGATPDSLGQPSQEVIDMMEGRMAPVARGRAGRGGLLGSRSQASPTVTDAEPDALDQAASAPTAGTLFNNLANTVTGVTSAPAAAQTQAAAQQQTAAATTPPSDSVTVTDAADADTPITATEAVADTDVPIPPEGGATNAARMSTVNGLYNQYLGRNGNPEYMQAWADMLADGASVAEVEAAIAASPEGMAFAAAQAAEQAAASDPDAAQSGSDAQEAETTGNVTNDSDTTATPDNFNEEAAKQQIIRAYQDILGRSPLDAGLEYWLNDMRNGRSIEEVQRDIRHSPEHGGNVMGAVRQMYARYLERGAGEEEIAGWLAMAREGTSLQEIEAMIANSEEARALLESQTDTGTSDAGVPTAAPPTATPVGSQTGIAQASTDTQTYEAATAADPNAAQVTEVADVTRTVQPEETVAYQLDQILQSNNPIIQRARTAGLQFANQRGLLNSSIAAQASQQAAIDAALPIAQQDARTFAEAAGQVTDIEGRSALQDAALGTEISRFNVSEENVTNRFNAESLNQAGAFNANAANTAIQNFLQREAARLLQDDQQLFTAQQNQADRELRNYLQERQFDFQGSENALDRELQERLQKNDQEFRSGESALDRSFQAGERALDRTLQTSEAALDRALSQMLSNDRIAFEEWSQTNAQEWNAAQNALQREFDRYRVDAQTASTVMYSTMESIAQIYADPNLNATQKQNAIRNVLSLANSTPALVSQITSGMQRDRQNELPEGVDETAYTNPEALLGDAFDPEANYWIGPFGSQYGAAHHPTWIIPPEEGAEVSQGIELITNPSTGQIYIAPTGGYRLRGVNDDPSNPGGGDGNTGPTGNYTGDPANLVYLGGSGSGLMSNLYRDPATGITYMLVDGQYVPFDPSGGQGGGGGGGGR